MLTSIKDIPLLVPLLTYDWKVNITLVFSASNYSIGRTCQHTFTDDSITTDSPRTNQKESLFSQRVLIMVCSEYFRPQNCCLQSFTTKVFQKLRLSTSTIFQSPVNEMPKFFEGRYTHRKRSRGYTISCDSSSNSVNTYSKKYCRKRPKDAVGTYWLNLCQLRGEQYTFSAKKPRSFHIYLTTKFHLYIFQYGHPGIRLIKTIFRRPDF